MNRDAMVIYLRDVRDLEVARHCLQQLDEESERGLQAKLAELERAGRHVKEPEPPQARGGIGCFVVAIFLLVYVMVGVSSGMPLIAMAIILIAGVLALLWALSDFSDNRRTRKEYEENLNIAQLTNRAVDVQAPAREQERQKALAEREAAKRTYGDELAKAEGLLTQYYALNVLPSQYRSLVPVCYIYEYMSTSQATLEDTLMHEHMENGFQRLEAKLDQVIAAVNRLIYETRVLRAENREQAERLARQNQLQLKLLERTERNAAEAARYAQLAECNTAACAYFELAAYLKD